MRIRTQFVLTILLFGALLIAISATAIITGSRAETASLQEDVANNVARGADELGYLSSDYVIYRESQQLTRWQTRFASFSSDVAALQGDTPEEHALIGGIRANAQRMKEVFDSVAASVSPAGAAFDPAVFQVSWSRMAVQTQGLVSDATRLAGLQDDQANRLQRVNLIVTWAMIAVFTAYFLLSYLMIQRRTLKSIAVLQSGAGVIGSGNLDYKLPERKNDEIGDLSRAFNQMTADLKTVTASKSDLEREVGLRREAEEELRASNQELQEQTTRLEEEIDQRRKAEEALTENEQRLRSLFSSMTEGVCEHQVQYDALGKAVDYVITGTNPAYESITGLDGEKAVGTKASDLYGSIPPPYLDIYAKVAETGEPYFFETYYAPMVKHFAISVFCPGPGRFVTVFSDISERKKAEAEIAHLASFPELNPNPIVELNIDGTVRYANHASRTVLPGLNVREGEHPFLAGVPSLFRGDKTHSAIREIEIDGSWYEQTISYVPATNTIRIYGRDVTERKQAEEDLRLRTIELEAANKELEAFTYSVSHDLREPLRAIDGFSRILLEDYRNGLDAEGQRLLDTIRTGTDRMGHLITDLLALSRLGRQHMNFSETDMNKLTRDVWNELAPSVQGRNVDVRVRELPRARCDPTLTQEVLVNLLSNAIKFTRPRDPAVVEVGCLTGGEENVYYVKDNGVGFDMRYADKLFGIFQRLHSREEFEGTGVGLAIVQRIVHRHGGRVWAESKLGEGATFYFSLPGKEST